MKKHLLSLLMTSAICAVSVSGYAADVSSIVSGAQSATQTASQVNAGVNNIAQTANAGQSTGAIGRGLQTATGKVSTGIQTATPYINDASTALNASQSVANAGNALASGNISLDNIGSATQSVNAGMAGLQQVGNVVGNYTGAQTAGSINSALGQGAGYVSQGTQFVTEHAGNASTALGGVNSAINAGNALASGNISLDNIGSAAQSLNAGISGLQQAGGVIDGYLGTQASSSIGNVGGYATQFGNAVNSAAGDISQIAGVSNISINSVGDLKNAISTINNAGDGLTSLGGQLDSLLGTNMTGSITGALGGGSGMLGNIVDAGSGAFDQISGAYDQLNGIASQVTGALEIMKNPSMLLSYINYESLVKMAVNAAEDALLDTMSSPGTGIPVKDSVIKTSSIAEKIAKEESSEIDNKIADEKKQQIDATGGRPAEASQTPVETSEEAPAADNCHAIMQSYPKQTNKAYDFVKINYLDKASTNTVGLPQGDINASVSFVEKTFFATDPKDLTKQMANANSNRVKYTQELISSIMSLGIGIQQNLVEDAASISLSITSGCNQLQDVQVNNAILVSLIKQTIADITLQSRLLELEAIKQVNTTPLSIKEKPKAGEEGGLAGVLDKAEKKLQSVSGTPK